MARPGSAVGDVLDEYEKKSDLRHKTILRNEDDEDPNVGAFIDEAEGRVTKIPRNPGGETIVPKTRNTVSTIMHTEEPSAKGVPVDEWRPSTNIIDKRNDRSAQAAFDDTVQAFLDARGFDNKYSDKYGLDRAKWPKDIQAGGKMADRRLNELIEKHNIRFFDLVDHMEEHYPDTMNHKMKKQMEAMFKDRPKRPMPNKDELEDMMDEIKKMDVKGK